MASTSLDNQAGQTWLRFWQVKPILLSVSDKIALDQLLSNVGLRHGLNTSDETRIPLSSYYRVQREIARSLDDLTSHLSSRKLMYQTGHFVLDQMKRARTLQEAMNCLCDYFNMMHGATYNSVHQRRDGLALVIDDTDFPYTLRDDAVFTQFVGDCVLIKVHCLLDSLTDGLATTALKRVSVRRSRTDEGGYQNMFWPVSVTYGKPVYELIYDFDLACRSIKAPDLVDLSTDGIFARVIGHLEHIEHREDTRDFSSRTRELIEDGCVSQDRVAGRLGVSIATLRRRLGEEDTSFRVLLGEVRFDEAKAMLERGNSVNQVSEQLDYSDIRAFNRAFKKWAGQTPAAFARSIRPSEA